MISSLFQLPMNKCLRYKLFYEYLSSFNHILIILFLKIDENPKKFSLKDFQLYGTSVHYMHCIYVRTYICIYKSNYNF